jgi:hypothetical protein
LLEIIEFTLLFEYVCEKNEFIESDKLPVNGFNTEAKSDLFELLVSAIKVV